MGVLGDEGRKERFVRLRGELDVWDGWLEGEREEARRRLEEAFREIGERDLETMDWSPNVESLLNVTEEVDTKEDPSDGYIDAMDID